MRGHVVVDNKDDYAAWLAEQTTFAQVMKEAAAARERPQKVVLKARGEQVVLKALTMEKATTK